MTKTKRKYQVTARDIRLLQFVWRWKLAPTAALAGERFFPGKNLARGYNRLLDLRKVGLIECHADQRLMNYAWTLTKRGFSAIAEDLPALREAGFKSENFSHDLLVLAFHLGDFLNGVPDGLKLFSEQELRRYAITEYPTWIPKSDFHRPDGYIGFSGDDKMLSVSIEVELNRKVASAYENVGIFYAEHQNIHRVLWLVPSLVMAKRIQRKITESVSVRHNIHNFVLLTHFRESGWAAKISEGPEAGISVAQFYQSLPRRKAVEGPWKSTSLVLLNTRKSYVKSATSPQSQKTVEPILTGNS
jgi:hypothetical protein